MMAMTTASSIKVKARASPTLGPPKQGNRPAPAIFPCRGTFLRITECSAHLCESLPDVFPVLAAGGHDTALEIPFHRDQGSRVPPAVNLGMTVSVRNHAASEVAARGEMRPAF